MSLSNFQRWVLLFCTITLSLSNATFAHYKFTANKTFTGTVQGDPLLGDGFGTTVRTNKHFLVVAAPIAEHKGAAGAGIVYVFQKNLKKWETIQKITAGGSSDNVGGFQADLSNNIMVISATGTPLELIPNETIDNQDFSGALMVYKLNRRIGEGTEWWVPVQVIDKTTPGLEELTNATPESLNPNQLMTNAQRGAHFGLQATLNKNNHLLLVSAHHQQHSDIHGNQIMNAGAVYALKLDHESGCYKFMQKLENPDGPSHNDTFGANVRLHGNYALISNSPVFSAPRTGSNGAVYVYHYHDKEWTFIQKLTGDSQAPTLVNSQFGLTSVGDGFGSAMALNEHWAIIGAGFESKGQGMQLSGAVYFYKFEHKDIGKHLVRKQKFFSDDADAQGTAMLHVDIEDDMVLVADPTRTGPTGHKHQGGAILYVRHDGKWKQKSVIYDPKGQPHDFFGYSVALDHEGAFIGSSPYGMLPLTQYGNPMLNLRQPVNGSKAIYFKRK